MSSGERDTPAHWKAAAARAIKEGIQVYQIVSSGQWVASSGSRPGIAYALDVTGNVAHACDCTAGQFERYACKHRAAFYLHTGSLTPPAPLPQAPRAGGEPCIWCQGTGRADDGWHEGYAECAWCEGTGIKPKRAPGA